MNKINLKNSTFIIPIRLEHIDRIANFSIIMEFLNNYVDTNIIIYEQGKTSLAHNVPNIYPNITYLFEKMNDETAVFHRTRYLNQMIKLCKTPVIVNYDLDILLPLDSFVEAQDLIMNKNLDVVFPYSYGEFQKNVDIKVKEFIFKELKLNNLYNAYNIMDDNSKLLQSKYGHAQFFKASAYISGGMENEEFLSYGPEDVERATRFLKLGYKVTHLTNNNYVYHLDHFRGENSSAQNNYYNKNVDLYNYLLELDIPALKNYYNIL